MSAASLDDAVGVPAPQITAARGLSLRWRLVLLVVASVVPLLAFSLAHEYLGYRKDVATTGRQTLAIARSMSLLVEQELQARIATLQTLTVARALQAGDLAEFRAQAETVVAQQFPGANILLLKEDGQQVMNTILPPGAPLPVRPNLESTRQVFATGRPAVSNLYQGAVGPRPVVAIDVPVRGRDGTVAYVLSLSPSLEAFAEIIRRQHPPATWVVSVLDRRGVNIARVPNGDRFVGHEAPPSLLGPLQAEREAVVESTSLEGIPLLSVFSHAERFGWAVAIGVPLAELTGPALSEAMRTVAVGGVILALGLALALYAARQIAGPIESLRRLAAGIDSDALLNPPSTGLRETDEVAKALRLAEENRKRSEQAATILREGIDMMPAGFVIYDDQGRLVICNHSYRCFYPETADLIVPGVRFEDILREGLARGRFPDAKGREEEWVAERVRRQCDPHGTIEQRLYDGRWVFVTKSRMANGYIAGVRIDITALKAAEQALSKSEEQLKRAQRLAHMGSDLRNLRTDEAEWSDETYRIFGVSRETYVPSTENFLRMLHPDDRPIVLATREQIRQGICPEPFEYRIIRPDGAVRQIYRENELIRDEAGNPLYLAGTIHDVTELRAAQGRERQLERQLMHSQKLEALGTLAGGVAHDLNNTLVPILALSKLALDELPEGSAVRGDIEMIVRASERARDLVKQILAFSRKQDLVKQHVDLTLVTREALRMLRATLPASIDIVERIGEVPPVFADAGELHQVVVNLITNAAQAIGGELGRITVTIWSTSERQSTPETRGVGPVVCLSIADTGCGMDQPTLDRVFEPFFTTKGVGSGTGLGLSVVHGIITSHSGKIAVHSKPGEGSEFTLSLPALDQNQTTAQIETAAA
jgi:PAS domain S-box-containing protein